MLVVIAAAAVFRLDRLGSIPHGISGDEASSGLEARRILDDGWIGPYSPLAAGQPAGPLYVTAATVALFGETVFALRLVAAIGGLAAIAGLYLLARRRLGTPVAVTAAALLASSTWHIQFSRFAVPLALWPLVAVAAVGALVEALRRSDPRLWMLTGALAAAGIYVYDAHWVLLAVCALVLIALGLARRKEARRHVVGVAVMVVTFAVVCVPMVRYMRDSRHDYFGHTRYNSLFTQQQWRSRDTGERTKLLVRRYVEYWDNLCCNPRVDGVDATGTAKLAPPVLLLLAGLGAALGLARRRAEVPLLVLAVSIVVALPVAAVISEGGQARRAYASLPFLVLLASLGTVELVNFAKRRGASAVAVTGVLAAIGGLLVYQGIEGYYGKLPGSPPARFVFQSDFNDAVRFMRRLPANSRVYFASSAVSFNHEIRQFLAPDVNGIDRSLEFGGDGGVEFDRDGTAPVFVLLDAYEADLPRLQARYPLGRTVVAGPPADRAFIAYVPMPTP